MSEVPQRGKPEAWWLSLLLMFEGQAELWIRKLLFEFLKKILSLKLFVSM